MPGSQLDKEWSIINYVPKYKQGVMDLILTIQNVEAGLDISIEQQPDLLDIESNYVQSGGGFWVAVNSQDEVMGSIGLQSGFRSVAVLKKFFVAVAHRGSSSGVASALFDRLIAFAESQAITTIILDTPAIATRSHAFYRKKGFHQIEKSELPIQYEYPDRSSLLFRLDC